MSLVAWEGCIGCDDAERAEARDVGGVRVLRVLDPESVVRRGPVPERGGVGVQRLADAPVADRVRARLEPGIQGGRRHRLHELGRLHGEPGVRLPLRIPGRSA